jgi:riboflavin synthase alpha subunit
LRSRAARDFKRRQFGEFISRTSTTKTCITSSSSNRQRALVVPESPLTRETIHSRNERKCIVLPRAVRRNDRVCSHHTACHVTAHAVLIHEHAVGQPFQCSTMIGLSTSTSLCCRQIHCHESQSSSPPTACQAASPLGSPQSTSLSTD